MSHDALFTSLIGEWQGTCRTWFEPGTLADESAVTGTIAAVYGGNFLRHTYHGSIQGRPRHGEELLAFNRVAKVFQSSWIDSFHMNYAILFSQGESIDGGFSVLGQYDVGENEPQWGWRTEFVLAGPDQLTITAYNIIPDGNADKAMETTYHRLPTAGQVL